MIIEFYVEEESTEAMLGHVLPKMLPIAVAYRIFVFRGKQDLLRRLPQRLLQYQWRPDNWRVVILVDQDAEDCKALKARLEQIVADAGLTTRAKNPDQFRVLTRIAVEELEAWFFGDMEAVRAAFPRGVDANLEQKAAFRDPDAIRGGTAERLGTILSYYFPQGLEKIRAAKAIALHMDPQRNTSKSFRMFYDAIRAITDP